MGTEMGKPGAELTFKDALRIARGCAGFGGDYQGNLVDYRVYHQGMRAVVRALETAKKAGLNDTQTRVLHIIGK
jgi:hypothetical protein